jgi:hypothetical protein
MSMLLRMMNVLISFGRKGGHGRGHAHTHRPAHVHRSAHGHSCRWRLLAGPWRVRKEVIGN